MNQKLNIALLGIILLTTACGKGGATASLRFDQQQTNQTSGKTSSALTEEGLTASTFKMKMIAAYLSEDVDPVTQDNLGNTQMIWINPECNDDIMHCNISHGIAEDGDPWSNIVTSFFDFSNSQSANTALNNQQNEIETGQYRYVRLEFCKTNPEGVNNVEWASNEAGVTDLQTFRIDNCGVNSVVFDPPLEVKKNDVVTISLSYSLVGLVKQRNYNSNNCSNGYCFDLPTFPPTATVGSH